MQVDIWQGNYTVVGSAMDGYDWAYADLKVTSMTCPARATAQYGSLEALSASQHVYAQKLSSWARFSLGLRETAPGAATVIAENAPIQIVAKKKRARMVVEELTETTEFFDLVAQVCRPRFGSSVDEASDMMRPSPQIVKVGPIGAETRDIFITDFSANPRLFKFDLRSPLLAEAQKPSEPFGRYCLKMSIFNELAKADNSSLSVGKIVKFRNAKVRMRDFLEGSLWGDQHSGCRIERLGLADEGVPELVECVFLLRSSLPSFARANDRLLFGPPQTPLDICSGALCRARRAPSIDAWGGALPANSLGDALGEPSVPDPHHPGGDGGFNFLLLRPGTCSPSSMSICRPADPTRCFLPLRSSQSASPSRLPKTISFTGRSR